MVYCITYDLNGSEKDYEGVIQAIEKAGDQGVCHFGESAWLVKTRFKSAQRVYSMIEPYLDSDDTCLVIEVTNNYQGYLEDKHIKQIHNMFRSSF